MSDNTSVGGTPSVATDAASWLQAIVAAGLHGASVVYHRIVSIEGEVTQWIAAHPQIGPLIAEGEATAKVMLTAVGLPIPTIETITSAVMSGLAQLAAMDPTVTSGGKAHQVAPAPTAPLS